MLLKLSSNIVRKLSPNISIYRLVGTELKGGTKNKFYSPEFSFDVNNLHLLTRFCQYIISESCHNHYQKQPLRGILKKTCSEIMQQMYRRIAMLKCDLTWVKLHLKCDCKATLFKSHFDMSIPQYICGIFSEQLFLRTHLERCFCIIQSWGPDAYLGPCQISVMQVFCKNS